VNLLVPNLGSTSLKYRILRMPEEEPLAAGKFERVADYEAAIRRIPFDSFPVDAVAFKTVHGGPDYCGTFLADEGVKAALERFLPAAPAHNRIYLEGLRAFEKALPGVPLVAAFETEFHATMPGYARTYGVPLDWREAGIQRYGFHGASHQFVSEAAPRMLGGPVRRLVSCHLGGSSSICAILDGRSIDTTMGFSPQSGLENATRHGDVDLFAALAMMEWRGWSPREVSDQLAKGGGLAGLSGIAGGDVRDLEAAGTAEARLALDVFVYQVRKTIGAYAAVLGGLDVIVFTGGIGENAAGLRRRICWPLEFLGVTLDPDRNDHGAGDRVISPAGSAVTVLVLTTNEEVIVARRAYALLTRRNEAASR